MPPVRPVLVTGATGYTGTRLVHHLARTGCPIRVFVRRESDLTLLPEMVEVVCGDLEDTATLRPALDGVRLVYHLAHVRFTSNLLQSVSADIEHIVIVSSLRALSRVASDSVNQVLEGEAAVASTSVPWTILRPSMIYGDGDDRNISRLVSRIRQRKWIPTIGANCLHQPVFVEDVIQAILACQGATVAHGLTFAIAGAAPLTWDALIGAVGDVVGQRPRRLSVPATAAAGILSVLESTGLKLPVHAEQVRRMLENKSYDIEPACRDLGFAPLSFAEGLRRIYADSEGSS